MVWNGLRLELKRDCMSAYRVVWESTCAIIDGVYPPLSFNNNNNKKKWSEQDKTSLARTLKATTYPPMIAFIVGDLSRLSDMRLIWKSVLDWRVDLQVVRQVEGNVPCTTSFWRMGPNPMAAL